MLSKFFVSRWRIHTLRDGPTGALCDGFAQALSQTGYSTITARRYLRAAEHFIDWTDRNGLAVREVNEAAVVRFGRHLGRCRCHGHADRESLTLQDKRSQAVGIPLARRVSQPVARTGGPRPKPAPRRCACLCGS